MYFENHRIDMVVNYPFLTTSSPLTRQTITFRFLNWCQINNTLKIEYKNKYISIIRIIIIIKRFGNSRQRTENIQNEGRDKYFLSISRCLFNVHTHRETILVIPHLKYSTNRHFYVPHDTQQSNWMMKFHYSILYNMVSLFHLFLLPFHFIRHRCVPKIYKW